MRYASAAAFRRALERRLAAQSRDANISLARLRKTVTFDRLLARLAVVAPDRWVLKGGLGLDYRFALRARITMDIDLAHAGNDEGATADLLAAQRLDLGDYFSFAVERTARLNDLAGGPAVRHHVRAELAGRLFEEFVLDVGFDYPSGWAPETLRGSPMLEFAGIESAAMRSLPLELQIAEKVHALTRGYGSASAGSTRVKDLVDLVLIASVAAPDAARLVRAIRETFDSRSTHPLPARLPELPSSWSVPYARMAAETGIDPDIGNGHELVASLLKPILAGETTAGAWNNVTRRWAE